MGRFEQLLNTLDEYQTLDDHNCLTLPPDAYFSPQLYEIEVEQIFKKEWLCVGREEQIPAAGDYYTIDVLREPMIIVRGPDNVIRALNSICRHRYMPVVQGSGNAQRFICPYHAWTYDTEGQLTAAPYMQGSLRFEKQSCRLPEYRIETWFGFIFVNLDDDAAPLAPRMGELQRHIAHYRVDVQKQVLPYSAEWAGTWKFAAENSMEYYHHVGLHKDTVGVQLPAAGTYVLPPPRDRSFAHERCTMGRAFKAGQSHSMNPAGRLDLFTEEELGTAYLVYVFPAFTMAMRPNGNNWLSFRPSGPERTHVLGGYLVTPELLDTTPEIVEQRRELIARVNEEDSLATTELARVIKSMKAQRGPLGPFEGTIAQFYRYVARSLQLKAPSKRSQD
jgi:phenylpropionate dioxygenase-like ring-hydroxylating dioxygenase large terminal subunit